MRPAGGADAPACLGGDWSGEALAWARSLFEAAAPEAAWSACERGDWMVRLLGDLHRHGKLPRGALVLATCAAARELLVRLGGLDGHGAARLAVDAASLWSPGDVVCEGTRAHVRALAWLYAADGPKGAALAACASLCAADCAAATNDHEAAYAADDCAVACATASGEGLGPQLSEVAAAVRAAVPWPSVAAALGRGGAP